MWKTVLRRVIIMIPQLLILTAIVFILAKLMPGDPFTGMITPDMDPATIEVMRQKAGLNDPWHEQYVRWMGKAFQGDFGRSVHYGMPVARKIGERMWNTFYLSLLTVILTYSIALPLGITAGRHDGSKRDKAIIIYNFISFAVPSFVLYLVMILVFGYTLKWFPTSGSVALGVTPGTIEFALSRLRHMILPATTMAILGTTGTVQYLRNGIINAKSSDYVRTARSKGVPTSVVYRKHIFRNSILPIAAFFGFTLTSLLGGSVIAETVFSYSGMGSLFTQSIGVRDYSVMTTLILLYGTLTLFGSLLSDIILCAVDPRIRIE